MIVHLIAGSSHIELDVQPEGGVAPELSLAGRASFRPVPLPVQSRTRLLPLAAAAVLFGVGGYQIASRGHATAGTGTSDVDHAAFLLPAPPPAGSGDGDASTAPAKHILPSPSANSAAAIPPLILRQLARAPVITPAPIEPAPVAKPLAPKNPFGLE